VNLAEGLTISSGSLKRPMVFGSWTFVTSTETSSKHLCSRICSYSAFAKAPEMHPVQGSTLRCTHYGPADQGVGAAGSPLVTMAPPRPHWGKAGTLAQQTADKRCTYRNYLDLSRRTSENPFKAKFGEHSFIANYVGPYV
jgi:hypothetical protein